MLRLFNICFNCDLRSASPAVIPLGVMGYIQYGDRFSMGLIARRALNPKEAKQLGPTVREVLAQPFEMLKAEQERVMASNDRVAAIQALVQSASSVSYEPLPERAIEAPAWVERKPQSQEVQQFLKDEVLGALRQQYWVLVGPEAEDSSVLHWHNFLTEPELAEAV